MKPLHCFSPIVLATAAFGCQTVDGDHIRAADLAAAMPAFAPLDPAMEIGLSPLAGIKRVFHSFDLVRLARTNGIELHGTPADLCFERSAASAKASANKPATLAPLAIHRGEKVAVMVSAGGVVLTFDSEAETSGRPGDTVIVLNPENGNRFVARVEDQGKVVVNK